MNALEMKRLKKMENGENDKGRVGEESRERTYWAVGLGVEGRVVVRWKGGVKGAPECVIEFFSFPSSVWAEMCVWPSVLGAGTEVSVWKDAVSPFCLHGGAAVRLYKKPLQWFHPGLSVRSDSNSHEGQDSALGKEK